MTSRGLIRKMPKVVIIGAGVSGLSCAQRLSKYPNFDVVVIEASNRLGGRIKSVELEEYKADIGASWMHETRHNELFNLALKQKWPMKFTDINTVLATQNGALPATAGITPIMDELEAMIFEDYHQNDELFNEYSDTSVKSKPEGSLDTYIDDALQKMPLVSSEQKHMASLFFRQIEHFIGQTIQEIPASEGLTSSQRGRDVFMTGNGYTEVIDYILRNTNKSQVDYKLEEEVKKCIKRSDGKYLIQSSSEEYEADFVVCTIPLGALKNNRSEILQFDIPNSLHSAIEKTSLAYLGKVVLKFDAIFWDSSIDGVFAVNTETQEPVTVVMPSKDVPVLMLLIGPPLTLELEKKPELAYDRVKWVFDVIKSDNNKSIPRLRDIKVSDWSCNPNFMCSYSARSIGQNYSDMIQPFIDGVENFRFAGEHTVYDGSGCVHGAYESGLREADYIKSCLDN